MNSERDEAPVGGTNAAAEESGSQRRHRLLGRLRPRIGWPRTLFSLTIIAVVAVAIIALNSSLFDISEIEVAGADVVSPAAIAQLTGLQGQNIVQADLDAAREPVLALPMVRSVEIHRSWPNRMKVVIVERRPWGRWRTNDIVWAIDREGVILEGVAPPADGPIITQTSALPPVRAGQRIDATAVELVAELDERGAPVSLPAVIAYEWSQQLGLVVITEHGRVVFGDAEGLEYKYDVWSQLELEAIRRGEPLLLADLRFGLRPRVEIGLELGRAIRNIRR